MTNLRVAGGAFATLTWDPEPRSGEYAVTRGLLSALAPGSYGACFATGVVGLSLDDAEMPPENDGFLYLVSGRDPVCAVSGPLGSDSAGNVIVNQDPQACP